MRIATLTLALVLVSGAAMAQLSERDRNWRVCANTNPRMDLDLIARACATIINSAAESPQNRAVAHVNRGVVRARQGEIEQALDDFEKAVAADPTYGPGYNGRATAKTELGRLDEALSDYERAIALDADDFDAYYGRGNVHFMRRDFAAAIADYDRTIALNPLGPSAINNRAAANEERGAIDQAIADYGRVIELSPRDAGAVFSRGKLHFYEGRFAAAAVDLTRSAEIEPSNPYYALWLHFALARDGRAAQSRLAERAREMDVYEWPGPIVRYLLGTATADAVASEGRVGDAETVRARMAEANFYFGEQALLAGDRAEAERRFRATIDSGLADFIEFKGARAELGRLGR